MLITGLALPYREEILDEAWYAPSSEARRSGRVMFAHGSCTHAIQRNYIELLVNHAWREHLASTKHGLMLFETLFGLYFHAELPNTPFAQSIVEAIKGGQIKNLCAVSDYTESEINGKVTVVRRAEVTGISLLVTCPTHAPTTWVAVGGEKAENRIKLESEIAERKHLWALGGIAR